MLKTTSNWIIILSILPVFPSFSQSPNTPHLVYSQIYNNDGSVPNNGDINYQSFITSRPDEILYHHSIGCGYENGYAFIECGNFSTQWQPGDTLHTNFVNIVNDSTFFWHVALILDNPQEIKLKTNPVELTSFSAIISTDEIVLNWNTASESNNFGFEIQRTAGNEQFKKIDFVKGYGTSIENHNYQYFDKVKSDNTYFYRLKQIDNDGSFEFSTTIKINYTSEIPSQFVISNYPNPFNSETELVYNLPISANVIIEVYNQNGQFIETVLNSYQNAGNHKLRWAAHYLNTGIYFIRINTPYSLTQNKCLYIK